MLALENAKVISIYFFEILTFFCILKVVFSTEANRFLKKLIGGIIVFIVAIIANNAWVYFMSLFIGGLIIASEDFLKFIFAVWKGHPDILPYNRGSRSPHTGWNR